MMSQPRSGFWALAGLLIGARVGKYNIRDEDMLAWIVRSLTSYLLNRSMNCGKASLFSDLQWKLKLAKITCVLHAA